MCIQIEKERRREQGNAKNERLESVKNTKLYTRFRYCVRLDKSTYVQLTIKNAPVMKYEISEF